MSRSAVLAQISQILDGQCFTCEERANLYRQYKSTFARIDGYCNKQCQFGSQLQSLGKQLIKETPTRRHAGGDHTNPSPSLNQMGRN